MAPPPLSQALDGLPLHASLDQPRLLCGGVGQGSFSLSLQALHQGLDLTMHS